MKQDIMNLFERLESRITSVENEIKSFRSCLGGHIHQSHDIEFWTYETTGCFKLNEVVTAILNHLGVTLQSSNPVIAKELEKPRGDSK